MADAYTGTSLSRLSWIADWHVRDATYSKELAEIVNCHRQQPFAGHWGEGTTSFIASFQHGLQGVPPG